MKFHFIENFWIKSQTIASIKIVAQLYCFSITLMNNDSGVFSIEKLARDPNTSGADQCFG